MNFSQNLMVRLSSRHLLKHPFYQAWTDGTLTPETLRLYATQYYQHVKAFPRYLSATHSGCEDMASRQLLLENLIEEEKGPENHPELWLRFAEALGACRGEVEAAVPLPETRKLVETFMGCARSSAAEGLGALFAYEHQIPEIATFKLDALKKHYQLTDPRGTSFFEVHRQADVYHTQALSEVMEKLPESDRKKAEDAARSAADSLWGFLDGIQRQAAFVQS